MGRVVVKVKEVDGKSGGGKEEVKVMCGESGGGEGQGDGEGGWL